MEKITAYIIEDSYVESLVEENDIDSFREIAEEDFGIDYETKEFDTEEDLNAFLSGFFFGCDERAPTGKVVLRDNAEEHQPFIEILTSC